MTAPTHPDVTRAHEVSAPRVLAPKRKATVRQVASTILASLAVAFVLSALVCLLPESPYQRWQLQANYMDGVLVRDYERIHFDPKPIDIAILGTLAPNSASAPTQSKTGSRSVERTPASPTWRLAVRGRTSSGRSLTSSSNRKRQK